MTIAPLNKIYWSDIEETCLEFIKDKCCNIDQIPSSVDTDFIYGNSLSFKGYTDATATMPYHDVTVTFTNNDSVCQVVTSETVRTQLRSFIENNLGSCGSLGFMRVSTYASILNLYSYIAGFISARLILIRHPFKDSSGYVFYNSGSVNYAYYGSVRISSTLSSTDILDYLKNTFNNASFGSAYGSSQSANVRARAMLLNMTNECITTGYPSEYAAYEESNSALTSLQITQPGVYEIHLVGAGGGGARTVWTYNGATGYASATGGGGAYVKWWQYLDAGNYPITIGGGGAYADSGGYGEASAGSGGSTTLLNQTAGGGGGAYAYGGIGAVVTTPGAAGVYSTEYTGVSGIGGGDGGGSRYKNYGTAGSSTSNGKNGAIVLFYQSARAPLVFEQSSGTHTYTIPRTGEYEIAIVGGGGGSSNGGNAGAGGCWYGIVTLTQGTVLSITIGSGGAGCPAYARNNSGYPGSASSVDFGNGFVITAPGGEQSYNSRGANRGGYTYAPSISGSGTYTTKSQSSQVLGRRDSWYEGKGTGGYSVGEKDSGIAGGSGYVCVRQRAGNL